MELLHGSTAYLKDIGVAMFILKGHIVKGRRAAAPAARGRRKRRKRMERKKKRRRRKRLQSHFAQDAAATCCPALPPARRASGKPEFLVVGREKHRRGLYLLLRACIFQSLKKNSSGFAEQPSRRSP